MKKKLKLKQYAVLLLSGGALLFSFEAYAHSKSSHSRMLPAAPENSDYYNNGMPNKHKVELGKLLFLIRF